jgi:D-xylose transport system permease protein
MAPDQQNPAMKEGIFGFVASSVKNNIRQYTMVIALLAIWGIFTALTGGDFLTARNLSTLYLQTGVVAILAIGMTMIIVAGHIDLSVGAVVGFTGAFAAWLNVNAGLPVVPTVLLTLGAGAVIGLWHGFWVAYRKVPAFIVTLSSMLILRGAVMQVTGGGTIGNLAPGFKAIGQEYLPRLFPNVTVIHDLTLGFIVLAILAFLLLESRNWRTKKRYGFPVLPPAIEAARLMFFAAVIALFASPMLFYQGIPNIVLITLVLALGFQFLAENTVFGRQIYAIGGNPEAARLSGVNIRQRTLVLFVIMGLIGAAGGIAFTARLNGASTNAGQGMELDVIAAVVVGGTSLLGGEGFIVGSLVGALVMASIDNGLGFFGNLDARWQYMIKGLILLLAVWADMATRKKS